MAPATSGVSSTQCARGRCAQPARRGAAQSVEIQSQPGRPRISTCCYAAEVGIGAGPYMGQIPATCLATTPSDVGAVVTARLVRVLHLVALPGLTRICPLVGPFTLRKAVFHLSYPCSPGRSNKQWVKPPSIVSRTLVAASDRNLVLFLCSFGGVMS